MTVTRIDTGWSVCVAGSRLRLLVLGREQCGPSSLLRVRRYDPAAPEILVSLGEIDWAQVRNPGGMRIPSPFDGLGIYTWGNDAQTLDIINPMA